MAWEFQGVVNAGIQVLTLIIVGYLFAAFKLIDDQRFLPQINQIILKVAMPAFNIYLVGLQLDLHDKETWRALGAFVMWVTLIQIGVILYTLIWNKGGIGEAGLLSIVLAANNNGMIGMPIMSATFGEPGKSIAMLVGVCFFIQIIPFSLVCFEWEKWVVSHLPQTADEGERGKGPQQATATRLVKHITLLYARKQHHERHTHERHTHERQQQQPHGKQQVPSGESLQELLLPGGKQGDQDSAPQQPQDGSSCKATVAVVQACASCSTAMSDAEETTRSAPGCGSRGAVTCSSSKVDLDNEAANHLARQMGSTAHTGASGVSSEVKIGSSTADLTAAASMEMASSHLCSAQPASSAGEGALGAPGVSPFQQAAQQQGPNHDLACSASTSVPDAAAPDLATARVPIAATAGTAPTHHASSITSTPCMAKKDSLLRRRQPQLQPRPGADQVLPGTSAQGVSSLSRGDIAAVTDHNSLWGTGAGALSAVRNESLGSLEDLKKESLLFDDLADHVRAMPVASQLGEVAEDGGPTSTRPELDVPVFALPGTFAASFMPAGLPASLARDLQELVRCHPLYYMDYQAAERLVLDDLRRAVHINLAQELHQSSSAMSHGQLLHHHSAPMCLSAMGPAPNLNVGGVGIGGPGQQGVYGRSRQQVPGQGPDRSSAYSHLVSRELGNRENRQALVHEATQQALATHGGVLQACRSFVSNHPQLWHMLKVVLMNPLLWSLLLALVISLSGLREFLSPNGAHYVEGLGWINGALAWLNGITVPLSLFSNGVWLYGKKVSVSRIKQMVVITILKLLLLPILMAFCAWVCQLDGTRAMSLVLLSTCPLATTAFVLAVQYNLGIEVTCVMMVVGTLLLTPVLLAYLNLFSALGIFSYETIVA